MVIVKLKRQVLEENLVRQNCTKKELAQKFGITQSYLSSICTGRRYPSFPMRRRFMEYFKCKFDDLFVIQDNGQCKTD